MLKTHFKRIIKRNKAIMVLLLVMFAASYSYAQQLPQFTQYLENRFLVNPAATGLTDGSYGIVGYRKQWAGFGQEPTTFYAGAQKSFIKETEAEHQPLALRVPNANDYHFTQRESGRGTVKHGVGGVFINDNNGDFTKSGVTGSYAAHVALNPKLNLGLGGSLGYYTLSFAGNNQLEIDNDATYARFAAENDGRAMFDFNLGFYLYHEKFFAGYSTGQLLGDRVSFNSATVNSLKTHHNIMAGYIHTLENDMKITTSTFVKSVAGASMVFDLNVRVDKDRLTGGLSYRNQDAIAAMIGYKLNDKIRVSYSYDFNTSGLRNYSAGGHEVVLGVKLDK